MDKGNLRFQICPLLSAKRTRVICPFSVKKVDENKSVLDQPITSSKARGWKYLCQPTISSEARSLISLDQPITSSKARGLNDLGRPIISSRERG